MRLIILITAAFVLGGCGPSGSQMRDAQAAESARKAEQAAIERQQREQTEIRLREQEARTSRWQFSTVLAVGLAGITLIIGSVLGSRARHDAEQ